MPAPGLLDLPRELRDKILSLVIDAPATPPIDTVDRSNRTELHDVVKYNGWFGGNNVYHLQSHNKRAILPIFLVNRQLLAEVLSARDLLPTKHCYALDIMIVDECELWPTWLAVTALTTRVDKVHATFRIIGTNKGRRSGFAGGCGGPPLITWCFYSILERFLRIGAGGPQKEEHDKLVSVKVLELDVLTPDVAQGTLAPKDISGLHMMSKLRSKSGSDYLMHPESTVSFIRSGIDLLLKMMHHVAPFGGILFERIGTIRLMMDGDMREEWDLASLLASVRFSDGSGSYGIPREERPELFRKWKAKAYKTRLQLGLPVVSFDQDLE